MNELKIGDPAPDFKLRSSEGGTIGLTDLRGGKVVLYFYPKDDTPGCTREACGFRDLKGDFEKAGAVILGISSDSLESHEKFIGKFHLNFPLLSDPEKETAKKYGVYHLKKIYGKESPGVIRSTFIIDEKGILRSVMYDVKVEGHMDHVLETVRLMKP